MRQWVIDTNVVVSGLLVPRGPSARMLDAVSDGRIRLVYNARILAEYRDVLHRPRLKVSPEKITAFLNALQGQMLIAPCTVKTTAPNPDDVVFIEVALATTDRTIVTGNLAHFPSEILHGVRVLTPAHAAAELTQDLRR